MVLFYEKEWEEKMKLFNEKYGCIGVSILDSGFLTYCCRKTGKDYPICLPDDEITRLMEKTLETGVDHLYEAVKDNEDVLPFYPEELYIENMQEKFPNLSINELL